MPRYTPIGVDVGSSSVKLAQLVAVDDEWAPSALVQEPWQNGDGDQLQLGETLVDAVRKAVGRGRFRNRRAVAIAPTCLADVRPTSVPVAEGIDLMTYVQSELAERHGERAHEFVVDFWIAGDRLEHGETKLELYTVAMPRQSVVDLVGAVEKAGLVVTRVDIAATAVATALSYAHGGGDEPLPVNVDIGDRRSLLFAASAEGISFCRVIKWGGRQVTDQIRQALHADFEGAEQIKKEWGLRPIGGASNATGKTLHSRQQIINDSIEQSLRGLALEIGRSLAYHARGQTGNDIQSVGLMGGGARLKGLPEYIKDALRLGVTAPAVLRKPDRWPTASRELADAEPPDLYGAAIGAALSGVNVPCRR
ncbi:MAG: pilus assembly protein PilM [Phycisphaerales bacterium]|nr:pilus assembly protein PilM [Phycisphaerales bacterium]